MLVRGLRTLRPSGSAGARHYAPPVKPTGWGRRLDDRADRAMKQRFGSGLAGSEELTLRKHLIIAVLASLLVAGVIFIALVAAGEARRGWTLLGPVAGVPLGVVIGHAIRGPRKRK